LHIRVIHLTDLLCDAYSELIIEHEIATHVIQRLSDSDALKHSQEFLVRNRKLAREISRFLLDNRYVMLLLWTEPADLDSESTDAWDKLAALGVIVVPFLIENLGAKSRNMRLGARKTLIKINQLAAPDLTAAAFRNPNRHIRIEAAEILLKIGQLNVSSLVKATRDRDPHVRYHASRRYIKLARLFAKFLIEVFQRKDRDPQVRYVALRAAGQLADLRLAKVFLRALTEDSCKTAIDAAHSVLEIAKLLTPPLAKILKDKNEDPEARRISARSLGRIGDKHIELDLKEAQQDKDPALRLAAKEALDDLNKRIQSSGIDKKAGTPNHSGKEI
jgi:HEAT repeat protein